MSKSGEPETDYNWIPLLRSFQDERKSSGLTLTPISSHPLEKTINSQPTTVEKSKTTTTSTSDPLSDPLSSDPLSSTPPPVEKQDTFEPDLRQDEDEGFSPWSSKKAAILQKYTTNESIAMPDFMDEIAPKISIPKDHVKSRLEELEAKNDAKQEVLQLTQKEYVRHIQALHEDLQDAWKNEKRVRSLKIAIKCAKLLGDTSEVIHFYPSKFVLISEILDTFGRLVFKRIKRLATIYDGDTPIPLKDNFRAEDVADHAKETCKNWFYKIASIRELLPRLFIEMGILSCYKYLSNDALPRVIKRLTGMIRGIGDPLVGLYARAYLARKAHEVCPDKKDYLMECFSDYMTAQKTIDSDSFKTMEKFGVKKKDYLDLFSPGLDWLLQCIAYRAGETYFRKILEGFKDCKNGYLLDAIISSFLPDQVAKHALAVVHLIRETDDKIFSKLQLYRTLGVTLVLAKPPEGKTLRILNSIWKDVTKEEDVEKYISVAEVFIEYPVKHCSSKEANILLKDILKHVTVDRKYLDLQPQLQSVLQKILTNYRDVVQLFSLDSFIPLMDLFRGETQIEVNKSILRAFSQHKGKVSDPVIINTLFGVAKAVHDSVSALTFADESRQISVLISKFISKMDFGSNVEKNLSFYVESRRAFANLDPVKGVLVKGACNLAVKTLQLSKGKHNKETAAFVRACISFCFITIPSMEDVFSRLYLYALSAQVSLLNQSLPQADDLMKDAITLLQEIPDAPTKGNISKEQRMVSFLKYFASILVAVPGHPERGAFYLLHGLLRVLSDFPWEKGSTVYPKILVSILSLLAASDQKELPYHFPKVESNDVLYYGTTEYAKELNTLITGVVNKILAELSSMKDLPDASVQKEFVIIILDLVNHTIAFSELNPRSVKLTMNLFSLLKGKNPPTAYLQSTIAFVKKKGDELKDAGYKGKTDQKQMAMSYETLYSKLKEMKF